MPQSLWQIYNRALHKKPLNKSPPRFCWVVFVVQWNKLLTNLKDGRYKIQKNSPSAKDGGLCQWAASDIWHTNKLVMPKHSIFQGLLLPLLALIYYLSSNRMYFHICCTGWQLPQASYTIHFGQSCLEKMHHNQNKLQTSPFTAARVFLAARFGHYYSGCFLPKGAYASIS